MPYHSTPCGRPPQKKPKNTFRGGSRLGRQPIAILLPPLDTQPRRPRAWAIKHWSKLLNPIPKFQEKLQLSLSSGLCFKHLRLGPRVGAVWQGVSSIHGLSRISSGPVMPNPSTSCGRATLRPSVGWSVGRSVRLHVASPQISRLVGVSLLFS
jgi:hypothetical protein